MSKISTETEKVVRRMGGEVVSPAVSALAAGPFAEALERAIKLATMMTISPRTSHAYAECWKRFSTWCEGHGATYLPADPAIVGAYLAERSQTVGQSALSVTLAALAYYHRRSGHAFGSGHPIIASVMKGILRSQKRPVRPAAALTSTEVKAMIATCEDNLAGVRDKALLLVGLAGAFRRGELVALDVSDIRYTKEGMVIRVRHSKADQEGVGADVGIRHGHYADSCPVRAMRSWLKRSGIKEGAIFVSIDATGRKHGRLRSNGFWRIMTKRAKLAGIEAPAGERMSPHGLRAGFISEAYLHGALDEQVMYHARQKSLLTTRSYRMRAKVVMASPTALLDL